MSCLTAVRDLSEGRWACLVDSQGIQFEDPLADGIGGDIEALRRLVEQRRGALLAIPRGLDSGDQMADVFEGWNAAELFLVVINERVALVAAVADAEMLRERSRRLIRVLADRLIRYEPLYRMNPQGRGFFFGRPKLDLIVVSRAVD
ncbi:MAG: hypothetical protein JXO72_03150 [Vicinamibacteria bacterium]|nr:hypothetical protein [Vicinamibacteria bacterium]